MMIFYWVQEVTQAGAQGAVSSWPSAILSGGVVGAVAALIGLIFAQLRHTQILRQTRELEDKRAREARELEAQRAHEAALQKYFEQVGQMLADPERPLHRSTLGDNLSTVARAQTLAVLEGLDPDRKRILLQFLKESNLVLVDNPIISLLGASLEGANLAWANLQWANLAWASLEGALLAGALLAGANLEEANLYGASLRGANLGWANLGWANLVGAILYRASLEGAILVGANLAWADLEGAENLTQEQLNAAYGDEQTKLPDHLQRPTHWNKGSEEQQKEG